MTEIVDSLCDPVLISHGIEHGFGQRGSRAPETTFFPVQVHSAQVCEAMPSSQAARPRADALFSTTPGQSIGIVTADCVPILVAARDGSVVAAIHAGWRGMAAGVIEAGLRAIRAAVNGVGLVAAVGPAARGCCYEVDEPVRVALAENYLEGLEGILVAGRPDRFQLDLPRLATRILIENGVGRDQIGVQNRVCTICDPDRFESHRRDGALAERLMHFISNPATKARQG
jgi:YfiH family protein